MLMDPSFHIQSTAHVRGTRAGLSTACGEDAGGDPGARAPRHGLPLTPAPLQGRGWPDSGLGSISSCCGALGSPA